MTTRYLSYFIDEQTPAYGGKQGLIQLLKERSISEGDTTNELKLTLPNHIGTHIDFPYHFNDAGKKCSDYPADHWVFNKTGFLSCSLDEVPAAIKELSGDIELLLLRTGFGKKRFEKEYWSSQPVIPSSLAGLMRQHFPLLRVFGFDMISMTSKLDREEGTRAHLSFLMENDILILEDMDLEGLQETPSRVIISPLLISGADGVPCTVIAF